MTANTRGKRISQNDLSKVKTAEQEERKCCLPTVEAMVLQLPHRDTKIIFHVKMGMIKDRKSMDLMEAEDIKKRWQAYTEKLYKKDHHNPVITMV